MASASEKLQSLDSQVHLLDQVPEGGHVRVSLEVVDGVKVWPEAQRGP